jgi:hypothetical protein
LVRRTLFVHQNPQYFSASRKKLDSKERMCLDIIVSVGGKRPAFYNLFVYIEVLIFVNIKKDRLIWRKEILNARAQKKTYQSLLI